MDHEEEKIEEVEVESLLNRETGELPFAYFEPTTEGKLMWVCNYDAEGKITSVTQLPDGQRRIAYLEDKATAEKIRDELIEHGWKKLKPPKVTLTYPGQKEGQPLSRKQRRHLQRKIKQFQKKNPFDDKN